MTPTTEALPPLPPAAYGNDCTTEEEAYTVDQMRDYARAALAQRQQVPEGWQLVPKVPTQEMVDAGNRATWPLPSDRAYIHMLAAAPALTAAPSAQRQQVPEFKGVPAWKIRERVAATGQTAADALRDLCAEGRAALTAAPSAQAEPVATVSSWVNGSYCRKYRLEWHRDVPVGTVLYAAPPTAQAEPQVPLSFNSAQRRRLWDNSPEIHADAKNFAAFERIVRLVESAHGIGKQEV